MTENMRCTVQTVLTHSTINPSPSKDARTTGCLACPTIVACGVSITNRAIVHEQFRVDWNDIKKKVGKIGWQRSQTVANGHL